MLQDLLNFLSQLPSYQAWLLFLIENLLITALVLIAGNIWKKFMQDATGYDYTPKEWLICGITNILNTIITFSGFWMWKKGIISMPITFSVSIVFDFVLLFLGMDFLMYIFHFIIHKTFLYRLIHKLHHQAVDPKPIDLFILHPIETLSFGALWLMLLMLYPFNMYAVFIYLIVNVIFGLIGHLGREPLSPRMQKRFIFRYLGTSTFHHDHHLNVSHNFGFYTNVWDRLFGTWLKP